MSIRLASSKLFWVLTSIKKRLFTKGQARQMLHFTVCKQAPISAPRWMDGWMDGWMDAWMDVWMDDTWIRNTFSIVFLSWFTILTIHTHLLTLIATDVKAQINHNNWVSHNRVPMDGALVSAGSWWPMLASCGPNLGSSSSHSGSGKKKLQNRLHGLD